MQLMGAVVPSLARLRNEENGQQKIAQYTRYLTIIIALLQSFIIVGMFCNPASVGQAVGVQGLLILTAGAVIMLWLGEQITQRGIGNGASILIVLGIVADIPKALSSFVEILAGPLAGSSETQNGLEHLLGMILLFVAGTAALVAITQAVRKIPVQYAKRVVGRKMFGGNTQYLPLKVNYAGVMPVIFAGAIISFLSMPLGWLATKESLSFLREVVPGFQPGHMTYYVIMGGLVFIFSYFWVSVMFKPIQVADDLKKNNGYIPGIRPGEHTAHYLEFVMNRLTFAGGVFLVIIALLPDLFIYNFNFYPRLARVIGGTSGLITVGVVLDTMRQVETLLLQRHYDGFLKKSRIGGVAIPQTAQSRRISDIGQPAGLGRLTYILIAIFVLGFVAFGLTIFAN